MTLQTDDGLDEDIPTPDESLQTLVSKSQSSYEDSYYWDGDEIRRKRHNRSLRARRRRRRPSMGCVSEDDHVKIDSAGEEKRKVFMGISDVSQRLLFKYLSQSESKSVQSTSVSSSSHVSMTDSSTIPGEQCDLPMESVAPPTSGFRIESWGTKTQWMIDSFFTRLAQWEAQLRRSQWLRVFEGSGNLLDIREQISRSLICLAENEIKMFELIAPDVIETNPVLQEAVKELSSLATKGKKLLLNDNAPQSEFSEVTGDLGAIRRCIDDLERPLREIKQIFMPTTRRLSPRKHEAPLDPVSANPYFSSVLDASNSTSSSFSFGNFFWKTWRDSPSMPNSKKRYSGLTEIEIESLLEQRAKKRTGPTSSTADKIPRRQSKLSTGVNLDFTSGESLAGLLWKLDSLKELWEKAKPAQYMNSLVTDVPPFAIVLISTDLSEIERFPLDLAEETVSLDDDNMDTLSETVSKLRLPNDSLSDEIVRELIDKVSIKYYMILDEGQASKPMPDFSKIHAGMEASLALLESLLNWELLAQPDYVNTVIALLPIIHSCLLDYFFKACSEFPTQLKHWDTSKTSELSQVVCSIGLLHRSIQRLQWIEISPVLTMGWERLQQPLQEVLIELDSLHDDLSGKFPHTGDTEEGRNKGATAEVTKQDRDMDSTRKNYGGGRITLPDMIVVYSMYLLFHFPHDSEESSEESGEESSEESGEESSEESGEESSEESSESSEKSVVPMDDFIAISSRELMQEEGDLVNKDSPIALGVPEEED
ncbi:hypothetical protein GGR51DRAFT_556954 [Nemania sp. FL0031]|nr:hypothetical protein GGR51DRAFT_556954 [Nemania sp. FL0031]